MPDLSPRALATRIEKLERAQKERITPDQLDIVKLISRLESTWVPDTAFIQPGSVSASRLAAGTALLTSGASGVNYYVKYGNGSAVFVASADAAQDTIPHGFGVAPDLVLAFPKAPVTGRVHIQEWQAADATNIYLQGFQSAGVAVSITQNYFWLMIGRATTI